jgi:hypothetical protein
MTVYDYDDYYKILPAIHDWSQDPERIKNGKRVPLDFSYCSDNNLDWMSIETLGAWIKSNQNKIGSI